jgi:hypothetical protein
MDFTYKIFNSSGEILLAIADNDIIGKTFSEDDLEIEVSKSFYSEKFCSEKDAIKLIKSSTIVNAVGEKIVKAMVKEKLVKKSGILKIEGVPHAQIVCMK